MDPTAEQVRSLAPDAAAFAAGRKLVGLGSWQHLGRTALALWGECQGSALYQVRVDLHDFASNCSCPSRKFPCKHALALLLLAAERPESLPQAPPPEWVAEWLVKRDSANKRLPHRETPPTIRITSPKPNKRAEKRLALVTAGIEGLDLWLADLIRNGLAGLELQPYAFWEKQAARLVDAQAPGLAARVRRLATIPGSTPNWPEQLLAALGRLALLTEAFQRLNTLDPLLQADVRGLVGWSLKEDEVLAHGDLTNDAWIVLGQWISDEDRLRVQRTWLHGSRTGRRALILQFSAGAPFSTALIPGTVLQATLAFWPSAAPQRALIQTRQATTPSRTSLPGLATFDAFLNGVGAEIALQPWLERFPCVMREVIPIPARDGPWRLRDTQGAALPLIRGDYWPLLAISGGAPVDLAAEWDGEALRPLGTLYNGLYQRIGDAQ